jgi:Domain of unknown function (DUF4351)
LIIETLEAELWQNFQEFQEERTMGYITTGERIGYKRGLQELVLRLLKKRVEELPEEVKKEVQALSREQLESLGEALLDFTDIDDLLHWLQAHR